MKQIIDKLIHSNNTDDWLIAYHLIIKEYGSFYAYPRNGTRYLSLDVQTNRLFIVHIIRWIDKMDDRHADLSKYAQL